MASLLQQLKERRVTLGLKQNDMLMRAGISRQQYQRLESKGNPRLDTLELVAKGLNSEIMLIPSEKLDVVRAVLASEEPVAGREASAKKDKGDKQSLADDPWQGLLGDEE